MLQFPNTQQNYFLYFIFSNEVQHKIMGNKSRQAQIEIKCHIQHTLTHSQKTHSIGTALEKDDNSKRTGNTKKATVYTHHTLIDGIRCTLNEYGNRKVIDNKFIPSFFRTEKKKKR